MREYKVDKITELLLFTHLPTQSTINTPSHFKFINLRLLN